MSSNEFGLSSCWVRGARCAARRKVTRGAAIAAPATEAALMHSRRPRYAGSGVTSDGLMSGLRRISIRPSGLLRALQVAAAARVHPHLGSLFEELGHVDGLAVVELRR